MLYIIYNKKKREDQQEERAEGPRRQDGQSRDLPHDQRMAQHDPRSVAQLKTSLPFFMTLTSGLGVSVQAQILHLMNDLKGGLELTSVFHECKPGRRRLVVKVMDIFGNDTMTIVDANVGG
ncbi:MAG: hypothetical protein ACXQT2_04775 [Methanotrichaceae archaeon]